MWSPYWLLPLLSFWLYPDWRVGLGVSMDRITLMPTCVVLHAQDTSWMKLLDWGKPT